MLAGKLGDVALQMLRTDLVESPVMRPFEHGPEGFHAVRVSLPANVLADRVVDGLVVVVPRQPLVRRRLVRVDGRAGLGVLADEALQGFAIHALDDLGPNLVGLAILHADHRTQAGAEVDLVLEFDPGRRWAVEIKRSVSRPAPSRGFHIACADLGAQRRIVVYGGTREFPQPNGVETLPLVGLMEALKGEGL